MSTWMIEGIWSGYTSRQSRVCHREFITNDKLAHEIDKIGTILFTDGTNLYLNVTRKCRGKRLPEIMGYYTLIRDAIRFKTNSVAEMCKIENSGRNKKLVDKT